MNWKNNKNQRKKERKKKKKVKRKNKRKTSKQLDKKTERKSNCIISSFKFSIYLLKTSLTTSLTAQSNNTRMFVHFHKYMDMETERKHIVRSTSCKTRYFTPNFQLPLFTDKCCRCRLYDYNWITITKNKSNKHQKSVPVPVVIFFPPSLQVFLRVFQTFII